MVEWSATKLNYSYVRVRLVLLHFLYLAYPTLLSPHIRIFIYIILLVVITLILYIFLQVARIDVLSVLDLQLYMLID